MKGAQVSRRWLRLRHDWPVRWAHHPLCARHADETWRVGRLFLCRGCASMAIGLLSGTVAVLWAGGDWCAWALLGIGVPVIAWSWPPWYRTLPRFLRDLLRAGAGLSITLLAWTVGSHPTVAWPLLPTLVLLWWCFRQARMQVMARRCNGCPELTGVGVCSGYRLHADLARTLEDVLEREVAARLSGTGELPTGFGRAATEGESRRPPAP